MLTPKMSLRRRNVFKAYKDIIEGIYAGKVGHKVGEKPSSYQSVEGIAQVVLSDSHPSQQRGFY